jgi:hypothetical protein
MGVRKNSVCSCAIKTKYSFYYIFWHTFSISNHRQPMNLFQKARQFATLWYFFQFFPLIYVSRRISNWSVCLSGCLFACLCTWETQKYSMYNEKRKKSKRVAIKNVNLHKPFRTRVCVPPLIRLPAHSTVE